MLNSSYGISQRKHEEARNKKYHLSPIGQGVNATDMDAKNEILTIPEVAEYLRVSRTSVWRWCNEGQLPAFKVGKVWRIRRVDMERVVGHNLASAFGKKSPANNGEGAAMSQSISDFIISINPGADEAERDEAARQLLTELAELEAVSAELAPGGAAPVGAKGDPLTIGVILVKIAEVGGITGLIAILGSWLSRDERRTVALQMGDNKIEVSGVSEATQTALIEWFQLQTGLRIGE